MVDYEVTISTSYFDNAGTSDNVFIKLLGFDGSSEHTKLIGLEGDSPFTRGAVSRFKVSCPASIGNPFQIKLKKQPLKEFPEDSKWFPTKVVVKSPEGDTCKFPIYKWIDDSEVHCFTEERVHIESTTLSGTFHFWPFSTNDDYRFVQGVLRFHYKKDTDVQNDSVLQEWISDIFVHGFLSQTGTGIPQSFTTIDELVKFVTMVIFTCSAQHSAVNTGQYDYSGWMPNAPTTLRLPPPTRKGTTSEDTMLKTLPDQGTTAEGMATMWLLSRPSKYAVLLGQYDDDHFKGEIPSQLLKAFQGRLQALSADINIRNKNLKVPYTYLDPAVVETSVAL